LKRSSMQRVAPINALPGETSTSDEVAALDHPFYFIVVLWGERFRDYFLDLCLPTLLAPGNLPALATRQRSKFLICTRPDDWTAMQASPVFRLLERYVDPVYLEIPSCPPGVSPCVHMGIGHRRTCQMAYDAMAYPFVLQPDTIFSNGMIARLQELASQGVELALVPALRFAEEPLFDHLQELGISPRGRKGVAAPITLSSRQIVHMALASMHSETKTYEWDAPYFHATPYAAWWRVPGEDGIVVHCMSWAASLLDFAAVPTHDTSTFDNWTIDGDYIYKNLGDIKRIHLVLDSDEMFIASWAPLADKAYDLTPQPLLGKRLTGSLQRKTRFNTWFHSGTFDPLKQEVFFEAARWHSQPLNERWATVEKRALMTLLSCVAPPSGVKNVLNIFAKKSQPSAFLFCGLQLWPRGPRWPQLWLQIHGHWSQLHIRCLRLANKLMFVRTRGAHILRLLWTNRANIAHRVIQILQGDRAAWKRATWRIRQSAYQLLGRQFNEAEPRM
jgi:hypothetical protein